MLDAIKSSIKYEINLFKKLSVSHGYSYYSIYLFTIILKHTADYILSKEMNKLVSSFEYLELLKEKNIISEDENDLVETCISISRRKDKLINESSKVDITKVSEILQRIQNFIDQS